MITTEDLMEVAEFTEQPDGKWKASLEIVGQVKLSLKAGTLPAVTRMMERLCRILAEQMEATRTGAKQAGAVIHELLMDERVRARR